MRTLKTGIIAFITGGIRNHNWYKTFISLQQHSNKYQDVPVNVILHGPQEETITLWYHSFSMKGQLIRSVS